ncbi:hypothetical protein BD414DRAFT_535139 [Trametes punicea]|nr:hypothetical protein BD414DRAFT_535139 [Trametes punicea]
MAKKGDQKKTLKGLHRLQTTSTAIFGGWRTSAPWMIVLPPTRSLERPPPPPANPPPPIPSVSHPSHSIPPPASPTPAPAPAPAPAPSRLSPQISSFRPSPPSSHNFLDIFAETATHRAQMSTFPLDPCPLCDSRQAALTHGIGSPLIWGASMVRRL